MGEGGGGGKGGEEIIMAVSLSQVDHKVAQ